MSDDEDISGPAQGDRSQRGYGTMGESEGQRMSDDMRLYCFIFMVVYFVAGMLVGFLAGIESGRNGKREKQKGRKAA